MEKSTSSFIDRLFRRLACYVGENVLSEHQEAKIIRIEELWRDKWQIRPRDLLWRKETLDRIEREELEG